ncbi:MAG TPA: hypothetical protein PLQ87_09665 [Phycisphaerae bacterium]|nr:hypothetical protein [Phycisphaerae bacterium]
MAEDLEQAIRTNAQAPRRAQDDAGSVEQQPLPDQIAADRYLASKTGAARKHRGLRFTKLISREPS